MLSRWFELEHGGGRQILGMEGLRGLAVLLVFCVHFFALAEPWVPSDSLLSSIGFALASLGHSGVDLFFVLSGFLIYGSLISRRRPYCSYLRRRAERIYPTFLVVLGLYLILSAVFPERSRIPGDPLEAAGYIVQNLLLLPGVFDITPIITVSWSLSYEFFFYLVAPLVILLLGLHHWTRNQRVAGLLVGIVAMFASAYALDGHIRMSMFLAGALLFEGQDHLKRYHRVVGILAAPVVLTGFGAVLLAEQHGWSPLVRYGILLIVFTVLSGAAFDERTTPARIFSWAPVRWLGNMSYSYYLIHGVTLQGLFLVLAVVVPPAGAPAILPIVILPLAMAATLVTAGTLFLLVERRFSLAHGTPLTSPALPAAVGQDGTTRALTWSIKLRGAIGTRGHEMVPDPHAAAADALEGGHAAVRPVGRGTPVHGEGI